MMLLEVIHFFLNNLEESEALMEKTLCIESDPMIT